MIKKKKNWMEGKKRKREHKKTNNPVSCPACAWHVSMSMTDGTSERAGKKSAIIITMVQGRQSTAKGPVFPSGPQSCRGEKKKPTVSILNVLESYQGPPARQDFGPPGLSLTRPPGPTRLQPQRPWSSYWLHTVSDPVLQLLQ